MRCSGYRSNIPSERFRASLVEGEVLSHSASGSYKFSYIIVFIFEATRELIWGGPRNCESWSDDEGCD
ncbi:unnamed protein product [Larinioides sclopetarius]|uniref:Uncharacterized protein n=1 Tax=Larinioides sclopetarius TaxID=280406 RepID=A0AAV2BBR5_9ARAC